MSAYVYRAFNGAGDLLYVGSTVLPGERMRNHYLNSRWWFAAKRITFTAYATEAEARGAEVVAIRCEHPRWNIHKRDGAHPDGRLYTVRDVARRYPQEDRQRTHADLVRVYNGPRVSLVKSA